jgi:hypothetical protein
MIRLFESVDSTDQGWDRVFDGYSPRSVFLFLLAAVFVLGADIFAAVYKVVRHHSFDWSLILVLPVLGFNAVICARSIYRRLER